MEYCLLTGFSNFCMFLWVHEVIPLNEFTLCVRVCGSWEFWWKAWHTWQDLRMNHNDNKITWGKNKKELAIGKGEKLFRQNKAEVKTGHQGFKGLTNIKKQIIKLCQINCECTKKALHVEASTNQAYWQPFSEIYKFYDMRKLIEKKCSLHWNMFLS